MVLVLINSNQLMKNIVHGLEKQQQHTSTTPTTLWFSNRIKRNYVKIIKDKETLLNFLPSTEFNLKEHSKQIFDGKKYFSEQYFDSNCSKVIKFNKISPFSCSEVLDSSCKLIHDIELSHSFFGSVVMFCWSIPRTEQFNTLIADLRIFELSPFKFKHYLIDPSDSYWITRYKNNRQIKDYIIVPKWDLSKDFSIDYKVENDRVYILDNSPFYITEYLKILNDDTTVKDTWTIPSYGLFPFKVTSNFLEFAHFETGFECNKIFTSFNKYFCQELYMYKNFSYLGFHKKYHIYDEGKIFFIQDQGLHIIATIENKINEAYEYYISLVSKIWSSIIDSILSTLQSMLKIIIGDGILPMYHRIDSKYMLTEYIFLSIFLILYIKNVTTVSVLLIFVIVFIGLPRTYSSVSPIEFVHELILIFIDEDYKKICENNVCIDYFQNHVHKFKDKSGFIKDDQLFTDLTVT